MIERERGSERRREIKRERETEREREREEGKNGLRDIHMIFVGRVSLRVKSSSRAKIARIIFGTGREKERERQREKRI